MGWWMVVVVFRGSEVGISIIRWDWICQVISTSVEEKLGRRDRQSDKCGHISVRRRGWRFVICGSRKEGAKKVELKGWKCCKRED